ncbi:Transposase DDE domain protein [Gimesia panareensis]|uniref:Transposase DDE domain protein n=1 Tax=Gimesia panareensis TaxID=2527978 RepID=A0A518FKK0_9PLAN|nr:transposase [Gimesia panareensis]QDV16878.1 Transposase DDE domain protein [Gimesia panareensis]
MDYRKLQALLLDTPCLTAVIELYEIPHFTTFQKAANRLLRSTSAQRLLDRTIRTAKQSGLTRKRVKLAAIDGTGFETRHIRSYFVKRRKRACKTAYETTTYTRYPSAGIVCDCDSHLVLAVVPGRGPNPDDKHYRKAVAQAARRATIGTILADAGYDSEGDHLFARGEFNMRTIIPATRGRPTQKLPKGYWRRRMTTRFDPVKYGQRWQVETVNSMIKRMQGSALRSRRYWSQCREIVLRTITHNIMILHQTKPFLQSTPSILDTSTV